MKAEFARFGPRHDYRRAHVTLKFGERTLLGEIIDVRHDEYRGIWLTTVRHMNGELWPLEPALSVLNILAREVAP